MIFPGKSGRVTFLRMLPSNFVPKIFKILRWEVWKFADGHTDGRSFWAVGSTEVENCNVGTRLAPLQCLTILNLSTSSFDIFQFFDFWEHEIIKYYHLEVLNFWNLDFWCVYLSWYAISSHFTITNSIKWPKSKISFFGRKMTKSGAPTQEKKSKIVKTCFLHELNDSE